ncbi:MAG TPA: cell division protein ZapA [Allosphingosinicella sp.]|jgi:cell division protein ZapA|nr:cell division protein ZapA [Allosphingosinicella sp.]
MANIEIEIAARRYAVACRDGEEEHLRSVAALVDKRARDAGQALGQLGEARLLLFTSLLLADDLKEAQEGGTEPPPPSDGFADAAEALADRIEDLAARLEAGARKD